MKGVSRVVVSLLLVAVAGAKNIFQGSPPEESRSRHSTWSKESEATLNEHIALEMFAAVQYRALYAFAARDWINLKKSAEFFAENAEEEFGHAFELMKYQGKRGGKVELKPIAAPEHEFGPTGAKSDAQVMFEAALNLEKRVFESLRNLHSICGKHDDAQCQDHVENYLEEQVEAVDKLARYVADLVRVGPEGHPVWVFDHEL